MKTSYGKFLNLAHDFLYDVKLRLLAHSRSFLANQKARNAIVGAENLLKRYKPTQRRMFFEGVLYFGWPNQPSSGTMENFASGRVFM